MAPSRPFTRPVEVLCGPKYTACKDVRVGFFTLFLNYVSRKWTRCVRGNQREAASRDGAEKGWLGAGPYMRACVWPLPRRLPWRTSRSDLPALQTLRSQQLTPQFSHRTPPSLNHFSTHLPGPCLKIRTRNELLLWQSEIFTAGLKSHHTVSITSGPTSQGLTSELT